MRFRRNADGKLDNNGMLAPKGYEVGMKFAKEARFMLGCALEFDANGNKKLSEAGKPVGKTLPLFEYTESMVVTNRDWEKVFWQAVKAPKEIKTAKAPWVENMRALNVVYTVDLVDSLPKIGIIFKTVLADYNVITVEDFSNFFNCRPDRRRNIVRRIKSFSMSHLLEAEAVAQSAPNGPPAAKDHRKATNPYLSRFGVAKWREEVLKSPLMKSVTNVRDLVEHIVETSQLHFNDSVYEINWYFYHDALSLMTATETVKWMKSKGYYKHWILPQHELNKKLKYYSRVQPVGNNPGGVCWDNSLNKDHNDAALRHVAATILLPKTDPRKFSLATPKEVSSTYRRLYEGGLPAV
jgi:hypothetical protein